MSSTKDVAAKAPTREEILAKHRAKAANKDVVSSDVVGYWIDTDGGLPITGIPERDVSVFDSQLQEGKVSVLTRWKVTVPTEIAPAGAEKGVTDICKEGDIVGVWYKPGMSALRKLGGVEVTMSRDPKKDKVTKKGLNPMKAFLIQADGIGQTMRIGEDRRDKSKGTRTPFDVQQSPASAPQGAPPVDESDDDAF